MARYTGPITKKSRRLGTDLVGNDQAFNRRPYPPGVHGRGRAKESEYLLQLKEKQKARYAYGVLEKQFRRYYEEANRLSGKTGDNLLIILESRLDNVIYRAGFAATRRQARQLVVHGHFLVNGKKVNVPSYRVTAYDVIDVKPKSLNIYTSAMKAYFDLKEFQRSNEKAGEALGIDPAWPLDQKLKHLAKLPVTWYGGADLSKLHDLTAAALHGEHSGIDIAITHAWFPVVAAAIKAEDPNALIIMCSAMGQQAMVIESIQAGARDFIVKPFQATRVLEAVKKVIG